MSRGCARFTTGHIRAPERFRSSTRAVLVALAFAALLFAIVPSLASDEPSVQFPVAGHSATIPFTLYDNHILVAATIDGHGPFNFVLDTGGGDSVTPAALAQAGLPPVQSIVRNFGRRSLTLRIALIPRVALGRLVLIRHSFLVNSYSSICRSEDIPHFAGFLGRAFFHELVATIDYHDRLLTFADPSDFAYSGPGTKIPIKFNLDAPEVGGTIGDAPVRFVIDTGSRASVLLPYEAGGPKPPSGVGAARIVGWGIAGPIWARQARVDRVMVGPLAVARPLVAAMAPVGGYRMFSAFTGAANLGAQILEQFTVTLDYARNCLYLQPNADYGRAIGTDRSGLWANPDAGKGFVVEDVVAAGPAAHAGLAVGDEIVAVDGRPAAHEDVAGLRAKLAEEPAGSTVKLKVLRGAQTLNVAIVLRDLV